MRNIRLLVVTAIAVLASVAGFAPAQAVTPTPYQATVSAGQAQAQSGSTVSVSGTVSGGPVAGKKVTLYWTRASEYDTWHKIGTARLSSAGAYTKAFKPKEGGDVTFRVTKAASDGHAKAEAVSSVLPVFQWQSIWRSWLNGVGDSDGPLGATAKKQDVTIGGTTYHNALVINDRAIAKFYTEGCGGVEGTVRIPESSAVSAGSVTIKQPGTPLAVSSSATKTTPTAIFTDVYQDEPIQLVGSAGNNGGTANVIVVTGLIVNCDAPA